LIATVQAQEAENCSFFRAWNCVLFGFCGFTVCSSQPSAIFFEGFLFFYFNLRTWTMASNTHISVSTAALALLAACGGSSTSDVPISLSPANFAEGTTPILFDPDAGTLELDGTTVANIASTLLVLNGDGTVAVSPGNTRYTALARNADAYAVSAATVDGSNLRGFTYGRRGDTGLPTTGSASFSGDYVGTFGRDSQGIGIDQTIVAHVDGDVALLVSFTDQTLVGSITNRQAYNLDGNPSAATTSFADAMITGGILSNDGTFDATVTGGERTTTAGTFGYTGGTANGAFAGATANSVAGVVSIGQTGPISGDAYTEIGAFVATQD
jgi:hypothetical protein